LTYDLETRILQKNFKFFSRKWANQPILGQPPRQTLTGTTRQGLSEKADPHGANGSDACNAQQHNLLSYLAFCGQKSPKNTLHKVRNVGLKFY